MTGNALCELRNVKQLQHIESPDDLKELTIEQLEEVCDDLRNSLSSSSVTCSHFGSSLGTVELTVHSITSTTRPTTGWYGT